MQEQSFPMDPTSGSDHIIPVTPTPVTPKIVIEDLVVSYSDGTESLRGIDLMIPEHAITVLFGPSGGGKSTLLRTLNRLNDLADVSHVSGHVWCQATSGWRTWTSSTLKSTPSPFAAGLGSSSPVRWYCR